MGHKAKANHPGVLPVEGGQEVVLLGIIEDEGCLQVLAGGGKLPQGV
jgi:hypothetical protein